MSENRKIVHTTDRFTFLGRNDPSTYLDRINVDDLMKWLTKVIGEEDTQVSVNYDMNIDGLTEFCFVKMAPETDLQYENRLQHETLRAKVKEQNERIELARLKRTYENE